MNSRKNSKLNRHLPSALANSASDASGDRDTRLLHVLHADHSTERGGAEFALLRMLTVPRAWAATVAAPGASTDGGIWQQLPTDASTAVVLLGGPHTPGASKGGGVTGVLRFATQVLEQALRLRRSPAFRDADVIHANTSRASLYCAIACFSTRKPLVIHLRDLIDRETLGGLGYALMTRFVLPRAHGVISNSRASLRSARAFIKPTAAVDVIHSAFGTTGTAAHQPISPEVRTIGMVARIDSWKGQDLLLRAFAQAYPSHPIRLAFAGSADFGHNAHLRYLKDLAFQLGIASRVDFLGHVEDVPRLISSWDICVQASLRPEPLGQNVLQYLAAGRPTVVTDQGGPAEWVRDGWNGWTFRMGDRDDLSRALVGALDPARRQIVASNAPSTPGLLTDRQVAAAHGAHFLTVYRSAHR